MSASSQSFAASGSQLPAVSAFSVSSSRCPPSHPRSTGRCVRNYTVMQDLDDVAVLDEVLAADPLAVEPGRRPPDPGAGERRGQVVVDPVGDVGDGRSRLERERAPSSVTPFARRRTRISPVSRQTASRNASRLASSMTETGSTVELGKAARSRSIAPRDASSERVAARNAGFSIPASATSSMTGAELGRIGVGAGAVDDRVGRAQDAEQRPSPAPVLGRALDQPGDLHELDEHATDPGQRRAPAAAS